MIDAITYYSDWSKRAYPLAMWTRLYHLIRRFNVPFKCSFEQKFAIKIDGIFYHYTANIEGMWQAIGDIERFFNTEVHRCWCGSNTIKDVNGEPADALCDACLADIARTNAEYERWYRSLPLLERARRTFYRRTSQLRYKIRSVVRFCTK